MQTSSLFARANIQPFCTCKRAILPVANLDTYVVLFVLSKGVKDEVEKVFQPKRRGKSLNSLTVSVWRSEVNDVKGRFKRTRKRQMWTIEQVYFMLVQLVLAKHFLCVWVNDES